MTDAEKCTKLVERIAEATGIKFTFGYIGNLNGYAPGTPAYRDDRYWQMYAPHPGRVGTHKDCIGGWPTDKLDKAVVYLQGALAMARFGK